MPSHQPSWPLASGTLIPVPFPSSLDVRNFGISKSEATSVIRHTIVYPTCTFRWWTVRTKGSGRTSERRSHHCIAPYSLQVWEVLSFVKTSTQQLFGGYFDIGSNYLISQCYVSPVLYTVVTEISISSFFIQYQHFWWYKALKPDKTRNQLETKQQKKIWRYKLRASLVSRSSEFATFKC